MSGPWIACSEQMPEVTRCVARADGVSSGDDWLESAMVLTFKPEIKREVVGGYINLNPDRQFVVMRLQKYSTNDMQWFDEDDDFVSLDDVSHWMPLPEPPK